MQSKAWKIFQKVGLIGYGYEKAIKLPFLHWVRNSDKITFSGTPTDCRYGVCVAGLEFKNDNNRYVLKSCILLRHFECLKQLCFRVGEYRFVNQAEGREVDELLEFFKSFLIGL